MSGTGVGITQVDRIAGLVYDAIVASTDKLLAKLRLKPMKAGASGAA
jgi:hypothetical protein